MIYTTERLTRDKVYELLTRCNNSFSPPLFQNIPYTPEEYAEKLANNASFVVCHEDNEIIGFTAYYTNIEGGFIYIPQIWVSDYHQRKGIGAALLDVVVHNAPSVIQSVRLEVRKNNEKAIGFYKKSGFSYVSESDNKCLLEKRI